MLHIAICEENLHDQEHLICLLEEYLQHHSTTISYDIFPTAAALKTTLKASNSHYDIFLLDISLPPSNWVILANELRQKNPATKMIFLTSSTDFVEESYALGAYYYMLKPLQSIKFFQLLDRLLAEPIKAVTLPFLLRSIDGFHRLQPADIIYIEAMRKKYQCYLSNDTMLEGLDGFAAATAQLRHSHNFIKPHRSYVVNMNYIIDCFDIELRLTTKTRIPVARGVSKQVMMAFLNYWKHL
jgi:DNA-binding LytR/AlgR family response regulator